MRFIRLGNRQLSSSQSTELRNKIKVINHQVKKAIYRYKAQYGQLATRVTYLGS